MNAIKYSAYILLALLIMECTSKASVQSQVPKPNIILFFVDDLGWQDTSVPFYKEKTPFNKRYQTPNMERLVEVGMKFTNAYSASPVCTPTRSSIITGKNPGRTNITNWTLRNDLERQETARGGYPLRSPKWKVEGVQPDSTLLTRILQKNGYRTIHAGKAHFGAIATSGAHPKNLGFDVNIAGHATGAPGSYLPEDKYGNNQPKSPWGVPGLEQYYDTDKFLTQALTIEVNKAIDQAIANDEPFFVNMAHYAVHAPIMADDRYFEDYLAAGLDSTEARYASMIEGMDASLGKIWQNLKEEDVAENTIILFMSDNGGLSAHARGTTPMGTGANTHNKPLRSGKGSAYEGGIRVPMMAAWAKPNGDNPLQKQFPVKQGATNNTPMVSTDFYPTILELAGIDYKKLANNTIDGQSFVTLLAGEGNSVNGQSRALFWHYPHKWGPDGPGLDPFTAVRKGQWKLIYFYKNQQWELYNLAEDIGETNNLLDDKPAKARALAGKMRNWMKKVDAQTPVSRKTGKPLPLPVLN